jgi:two-component system chemotaxis response regulator CheY
MAADPSMTILCVDDFSTMRRIIIGLLKQLGFKNIVEADDGSTAMEILKDRPIDFVISDWNMPKMTGLDLLKAVRADEKLKGMPFLMVTAESEKEHILAAVKAGVSNYVVKPFKADVLQEKIAKIFGA